MRRKFIPTNNDLSYYPLLFMALEATKGDIIEMGTGHGSTALLNYYILGTGRKLFSFETEKMWLDKFVHMSDEYHSFTLLCRECWDACSNQHNRPSVVLVDHAPGERRKEDVLRFKDKAEIIVVHDTEPTGAGDYQVRQHFSKFKYVCEVQSLQGLEAGAWATALSNTIDITKWIDQKFGDYKISPQWK